MTNFQIAFALQTVDRESRLKRAQTSSREDTEEPSEKLVDVAEDVVTHHSPIDTCSNAMAGEGTAKVAIEKSRVHGNRRVTHTRRWPLVKEAAI